MSTAPLLNLNLDRFPEPVEFPRVDLSDARAANAEFRAAALMNETWDANRPHWQTLSLEDLRTEHNKLRGEMCFILGMAEHQIQWGIARPESVLANIVKSAKAVLGFDKPAEALRREVAVMEAAEFQAAAE